MKYDVHMLAFEPKGTIRTVNVPEDISGLSQDDILELIFYWGQNDFQSQQCHSVSVGDVIELDGKFFLVSGVGFQELSATEFEKYDGNLDEQSRLKMMIRALVGKKYN